MHFHEAYNSCSFYSVVHFLWEVPPHKKIQKESDRTFREAVYDKNYNMFFQGLNMIYKFFDVLPYSIKWALLMAKNVSYYTFVFKITTTSQNIYFRFTYILQECKITIVKLFSLYKIQNEYSTRGKPYSRANKEEKTIFQTLHKSFIFRYII